MGAIPSTPKGVIKPALQERSDANLSVHIGRSPAHEHANPPHPLALLCARRERPGGRCAAEQRDELAALHSITSSARASRVGGMVRPSNLAVATLMTSTK
jgi:hypothetical protein